MSLTRYGRKYSLIIGSPEKEIYSTQSEGSDGFNNYTIPSTKDAFDSSFKSEIKEASFIEITNPIQMRAVLPQSKTNRVDSDKAYIELYNLSDDTLQKIQNSELMFMKGGYETDDELPYLFTGEFKYVSSETKNSNTITTLICAQKVRVGKDIRVSKTYVAGTSFHSILRDLISYASKNGIPTRSIRLPSGSGSLDRPYNPDGYNTFTDRALPVEGYVLDEISRVAAMIRYRSYMVMGELYIEPIDNPKFTVNEEVKVGLDNIQTSIKHSKKIANNPTGKKETREVSLNLFLDGRISVGKWLRIIEGDFKGSYEIIKVQHVLNLEGKDWTTEVVARERD